MCPMGQSRSLVFGISTMFAFMLLAPVAMSAQEEVAALAPVAAPAVVSTGGDDVRTARAIAAERALQSGDIGSLQEDRLLAIVAAASSRDETGGYPAYDEPRTGPR